MEREERLLDKYLLPFLTCIFGIIIGIVINNVLQPHNGIALDSISGEKQAAQDDNNSDQLIDLQNRLNSTLLELAKLKRESQDNIDSELDSLLSVHSKESARRKSDLGVETRLTDLLGRKPTDEELKYAFMEIEKTRIEYQKKLNGNDIEEELLTNYTNEIIADDDKRTAWTERLKSTDGMTFLRTLNNYTFEPEEIISALSSESFPELFRRRVLGFEVYGEDFKEGKTIPPDGTTINFSVGIHTLNIRMWRRSKTFPKDILIKGKGMNNTLVKLNEISTRSQIRSLTFSDITIDCGNKYFIDIRKDEPVTIRLMRCRVIGFDMGAGGSVMMGGRVFGFYATDSVIEAGFGRSPGSGSLFRSNSKFF